MVISVHHYELAPGVSDEEFVAAAHSAEDRGFLDLPGLVSHHLVRGLKGSRKNGFAAIWVYESRAAWERLWGPPDSPKRRKQQPDGWRKFEDEVLAPLLAEHPDAIDYTAYEEV